MTMIRIAAACLGMISVGVTAGAQEGTAARSVQSFTFRPGQRVYIAAYQTFDHFASRQLAAYPPGKMVDRHLPAEFRIGQEFWKAHRYILVNKVSEADFVFLALIHESAAEGLAMAPGVFTRYQSNIDIDGLREAAYERVTVGPLNVHTLGRLSERLVDQFHTAASAGGGAAQ